MFNRLLLIAALLFPLLVSAAQPIRAASPFLSQEATFLSMQLKSNGLGTVVAKPCDDECDLIYARIDSRTLLSVNQKPISVREARKLKWSLGSITVDDNGKALALNLLRAGPGA